MRFWINPRNRTIAIGPLLLCRERAGVISEEPIWVLMHDCYMYESESLFGLMRKVVTQWKDDNNMVG